MIEQKILLVSCVLYLASIFLFLAGKKKLSLAILVIAAFLTRYWAATLFPYLNDWDERFHALVGKNLIAHPWKPTMVERPVLPIDFKDWTGNHIWVHKQPLFLWQIALSVFVFGVNEMAVRMPSIVLSSLLVLITYRIGSLAFNERTGYVGGLLIATSFPLMMLVTGVEGMDHNDISFMFYVTASIWAWLEYEQSKNIKWVWLMGALAGAAVLCKWVTGMLVFGMFGFGHLFIQKDFFTRNVFKVLLQGLLVCVLVALPWQIYILLSFHQEAVWEYSFSARHFSEVLEDHKHAIWYYVEQITSKYQMLFPFIIVGIGTLGLRKEKFKFSFPLFIGVLAVYIFFSLAATKLPGYVLMVMPLMYLLIASGFVWVVEWLFARLPGKVFHALLFILLSLGAYQNLRLYHIFWSSLMDESYYGRNRLAKKINTESFKAARLTLPKDYVIIWCNGFERVECMFYTGNTAYSPIEEYKVQDLHSRGVKLAVFNREDLPDYIRNDSLILKLPYEMKLRVAD
ncbi:MAG: glycosyltransferase family 39 protein [Bacteroidetes bacterium]|nr:glycosyltransferase family 39 protein [Bacteroidota bacterium]